MKVAKCTEFGHSILLCRIDDRLIWARDRLSGAIPLFVAISDWLCGAKQTILPSNKVAP